MKRTGLKAFWTNSTPSPSKNLCNPSTLLTHTGPPLCVCVCVCLCTACIHTLCSCSHIVLFLCVCVCVFMQPEGIKPNYNILLINRVCSRGLKEEEEAGGGGCCVQLAQPDHTLYK